MSGRVVAVFLTCCPLFFGAYVLCRHPTVAADAPVIRLPSQDHDFGILLPFTTARYMFSAVNSLSQTLYIDRLVRSCGCTTAVAEPVIVAPGETFSVTAILSVHAAGEGVVSHVDVLAHAGGQAVEWNLQLLADVENAIEFPQDEGYIRLGSYFLNQLPASETIQVQRGRYPLDFDALGVQCGDPALSAVVHKAGGGSWNVTFTVHSSGVLGASGYPVSFRLLSRGRVLDVGVEKQAYVEVRGPVVAAPSSLLLTLSPGEHVRKSIEIAARGGGPAPRITAAFTNSKNAGVSCRQDGGRSWVDLDYTAAAAAGEDRGEITVSALLGGVSYTMKIGFMAIVSG